MRLWIILSFILALFAFASLAQDESTATAAPSKTPDPSETASPESTEVIAVTEAPVSRIPSLQELPRSYTQEDLQVLVGNVQRPNGIVFFDNELFTACNGDWTLYQINAETAQTITFVFGVRNTHQMVIEETEAGFDLWIPDFDTNQFVRVNQSRTAPVVVAREGLDAPWGIATLDEERFLISNLRADNLVVMTRDGDSSVALEGLRSPAGLVVEGDFAYVANNGSARRAIEWFAVEDLAISEEGEVTAVSDITQPLVSGLQNVSNLVYGADGYLYFTYALGTRGIVGRVNPEECRDGGCSNAEVEIVLFTELPAPLAGLSLSPDMRLFVHTIYRPEIYWLQLYQG